MNLVKNFKQWREYRATCQELARLTQRELSDLGIDRADITKVARSAAGY